MSTSKNDCISWGSMPVTDSLPVCPPQFYSKHCKTKLKGNAQIKAMFMLKVLQGRLTNENVMSLESGDAADSNYLGMS